jgi:formylmethanofuran dehydrogenase subunit E
MYQPEIIMSLVSAKNPMSKLKEIKCERCGEPLNPQWCNDDHLDREVCEECQKAIDEEEQI